MRVYKLNFRYLFKAEILELIVEGLDLRVSKSPQGALLESDIFGQTTVAT